jgi:hypothetical protein
MALVVDTSAPGAPYPADTKAKGWRFELDHERIEQSDTWVLASPDMRPWLLMLWMTAWRQVPCGSLPASDELIAARIGMPTRTFQANKDLLMRGWALCADGRMYHAAITEQVLALIGLREKEAVRKQAYRDKQKSPPIVPWDTHGIPPAATPPEPEPELEPDKALNTHPTPTLRGRVCLAMKAMGVFDVSPGHAELHALIDAGATIEEFASAAKTAAEREKGFAYALGIVKRQRIEAAKLAKKVLKGDMPRTENARDRASATAGALIRTSPDRRNDPAIAFDFDLDTEGAPHA